MVQKSLTKRERMDFVDVNICIINDTCIHNEIVEAKLII